MEVLAVDTLMMSLTPSPLRSTARNRLSFSSTRLSSSFVDTSSWDVYTSGEGRCCQPNPMGWNFSPLPLYSITEVRRVHLPCDWSEVSS